MLHIAWIVRRIVLNRTKNRKILIVVVKPSDMVRDVGLPTHLFNSNKIYSPIEKTYLGCEWWSNS